MTYRSRGRSLIEVVLVRPSLARAHSTPLLLLPAIPSTVIIREAGWSLYFVNKSWPLNIVH